MVYVWRIDLSKSEKYWDGWFRGTSNLFLACNLPKLLLLAGGFLERSFLWQKFYIFIYLAFKSVFFILRISSKLLLFAGIDRLDRNLTIGQMQGETLTTD